MCVGVCMCVFVCGSSANRVRTICCVLSIKALVKSAPWHASRQGRGGKDGGHIDDVRGCFGEGRGILQAGLHVRL